MLSHMQIQNFAIVKTLELDFQNGMTTITGETGAGKSIAIDALGLCLGQRAEASMVRNNEDKAEITTYFQLVDNSTAKHWLAQNDLLDGEECILRRVITKEGRSRAYINGCAVPVSQQKALGQFLINIHGQHEHQHLMRNDHQLNLLDQYSGHASLLQNMQTSYSLWKKKYTELQEYEKHKEALKARQQLLEYQTKELNELAIGKTEYEELEQEHKKLSNADDIASSTQAVIEALCDNDESNALQLLKFAQQQLTELSRFDTEFTELNTMIDEACIQIQEVSSSITSYISRLEIDPTRLNYLDERIALILRLARKHQVSPSELYQTHQNLLQELEKFTNSDNQIEQLSSELKSLYQNCLQAAEKLSKSRAEQAEKLNKLITASMQELNIPHGQFHIQLKNDKLSPLGMDSINFLVSTNSGQPLQALSKVASGGELSRISLAISVITAQKVNTPSLIFDEVDVGISGPTAMTVGKLLRKLGESTQVMCVTHLPQVAGCGHQQMFVSKSTEHGNTTTSMITLDTEARIKELARLLGGNKITAHTLANAKELLFAA